MYDAELHHQWELEQQEQLMEQDFKDWDAFETAKNRLQGRLEGAIDLLKVAEQTGSTERRNSAIADILVLHNELQKLKDNFWGTK